MSRKTKRDRRKGARRAAKQAIAVVAQSATPESVRATKETVRKLRTDVLGRLYNRGSIGSEQMDAAEEIAQVYEAWGKCFFPKAKGLESGAPSGTFKDPVARLTPTEGRAWAERYRPWATEMGRHLLGRSRNTRLQLVLDVVVDNLTPRQLDELYGVKNGSSLKALQEALYRYCEIAGWVRAQPRARKGDIFVNTSQPDKPLRFASTPAQETH